MIEAIWKIDNKELNLINNLYFKIKLSGLDNPSGEMVGDSNPYRAGIQKKRIAIQKRSITIDFIIHSNTQQTRQLLYEYFRTGDTGELFLRSDYRQGKIKADVIDMPFSRHDLPVTAQLLLECPYPYFSDISEIIEEIRNSIGLFKFNVAFNTKIPLGKYLDEQQAIILNESDVKTGIVIKMNIRGDVENPQIYNATTNERIGIDTSKLSVTLPSGVTASLVSGDVITIDTRSGQGVKSMTLTREGTTYNIINTLMKESSWIQLIRGTNTISALATKGVTNMKIYIERTEEYGAI
jgi:hypothetical protein